MGGIASSVGSVLGGFLGGNMGANAAGNAVTNLPNLNQNTSNWQNLIGSNMSNDSYLQSLIPKLQNTVEQQYNNPFASAYQAAAGNAGNAFTNVGNQAVTGAGNLAGSGNALLDYAKSIMGMGFDPQSAAYNQAKQVATDTGNVTNAQYGLTGPYAAATQNQNMQNFNTNWQNNALQRAIQALGAGAGATATGGNTLAGANNLGAAGANNILQGGATPFGTANTITGNQLAALNSAISGTGGVNNLNTSDMNSLLSYIQTALGQQSDRFKAMQQGAESGASGGMQLGQTIAELAPYAMAFL